MINIRNGLEASLHLPQLRQWYLDEWGKIDSFEGNLPETALTEPPRVYRRLQILDSKVR